MRPFSNNPELLPHISGFAPKVLCCQVLWQSVSGGAHCWAMSHVIMSALLLAPNITPNEHSQIWRLWCGGRRRRRRRHAWKNSRGRVVARRHRQQRGSPLSRPSLLFFFLPRIKSETLPARCKKLTRGWVIPASFFVLHATCRLFIIQHSLSLFAEGETKRRISRSDCWPRWGRSCWTDADFRGRILAWTQIFTCPWLTHDKRTSEESF